MLGCWTGQFGDRFGTTWESFAGYSGITFETIWNRVWTTCGTFRDKFQIMLGLVLDMSWVRQMLQPLPIVEAVVLQVVAG